MRLAVDFLQPADADLGVNLGGGHHPCSPSKTVPCDLSRRSFERRRIVSAADHMVDRSGIFDPLFARCDEEKTRAGRGVNI